MEGSGPQPYQPYEGGDYHLPYFQQMVTSSYRKWVEEQSIARLHPNRYEPEWQIKNKEAELIVSFWAFSVVYFFLWQKLRDCIRVCDCLVIREVHSVLWIFPWRWDLFCWDSAFFLFLSLIGSERLMLKYMWLYCWLNEGHKSLSVTDIFSRL